MATKKRNQKKNYDKLIYALLYIIVGILFIAFRGGMLRALLTIVGVLFILSGVVVFFTKRDFPSALISILIGVVIILGAWLFMDIVLIVFGVLLVLKGVVDLADASKSKGLIGILAAVLTVVVGVLLILLRWWVIDWFYIIIGAFFILDGLVMIFFGKGLTGKK